MNQVLSDCTPEEEKPKDIVLQVQDVIITHGTKIIGTEKQDGWKIDT